MLYANRSAGETVKQSTLAGCYHKKDSMCWRCRAITNCTSGNKKQKSLLNTELVKKCIYILDYSFYLLYEVLQIKQISKR